MTLKQFVESTYFKGLARLCMIIVVPALLSVGGFILTLMGDVAGVKSTQVARAQDNDRFQAAISSDVAEVKDGIAGVQTDVAGVKLDVATIRGILQEMQRRDTAMANARAYQLPQ